MRKGFIIDVRMGSKYASDTSLIYCPRFIYVIHFFCSYTKWWSILVRRSTKKRSCSKLYTEIHRAKIQSIWLSTLNELTIWLPQTKVFITVDQRSYSSNGDLIKTLKVPEFTLHWLNNYRQKINTFILVKQVSPVSYGVIQRINLFSWVFNISKCFCTVWTFLQNRFWNNISVFWKKNLFWLTQLWLIIVF